MVDNIIDSYKGRRLYKWLNEDRKYIKEVLSDLDDTSIREYINDKYYVYELSIIPCRVPRISSNVICIKCGCNTFKKSTIQSRKSDESATTISTCIKCGYKTVDDIK